MFAMLDAKLPPPSPVIAERTSKVAKDADGVSKIAEASVGINSSNALAIVQFRPPNRATASV